MTVTLSQGGHPLREQVAEEIRALMARRKTNGRQLAKAMNRSQTYIWRRLSGETAFDLDDLETLAGLLGVPISAFFPNQVAGGIPPRGVESTIIQGHKLDTRSPTRVALSVAA